MFALLACQTVDEAAALRRPLPRHFHGSAPTSAPDPKRSRRRRSQCPARRPPPNAPGSATTTKPSGPRC